MMAHRSNGRGTLRLELQVAGVGRIARASGTDDPDELAELRALCKKLARRGRHDYLVAIRDGVIHPLSLLAEVERVGFANVALLPAVSDVVPVAAEWERWVRGIDRRATRRMYDLAWRHLTGLAADAPQYFPASGGVSAIAPALMALRKDLAARGQAATFNRVRASWQAFAKWHVGTAHSAYEAIQGVPRLPEAPRHRHGLTLAEAIAKRDALPAPHGAIWWDLVCTGLRVGEYYQEERASWSVEGDLVRVHDGKTKHAARVVPRLTPMARPTVTVWALREALEAVAVTPHIARYTFKSFALAAGVPNHRVEQYLGHALTGVDRLYGRVRLEDWAPGDRALLQEFVALTEQQVAAARKGGLRRA